MQHLILVGIRRPAVLTSATPAIVYLHNIAYAIMPFTRSYCDDSILHIHTQQFISGQERH